MARVEPKTISWNPSESSDVEKYRVYYKADDSSSFQYTDPYIETTETQVTAPDDFPDGTFSQEGDYLIGVSALDAMGNESDITEVVHPFDLVPPMAPTGLSVS
jgi:hypothetical protein